MTSSGTSPERGRRIGRVMTVSPHLGPLHLGPLHPVEQLLVLGLAFGPFLVLAVVIVLQRRRDQGAVDEHDLPTGPQPAATSDPEHDRA